jgi:hypothetical protein
LIDAIPGSPGCSSSEHLSLIVLSSLSILIFIPSSLLLSVVYITQDYDPNNVVARSSGRFDLVYNSLRLILVTTFTFAPKTSLIPPALLFVCVCYLFYKALNTHSYYNSTMNHMV